jgi:hypothetical protein
MTDIFQTPGDRLRFEILLKSLKEGGTNLAVLSEYDKVLDFYGDLFEERLLAQGDGQVEFCSSTNSERLVQKFNEILSELTLNQALEKDKKHAPRRYLVFRDSILMQDFELQLLARLVNGFPASNITVVLLINSTGNYRNKLQAFGKSLVEWEVETQASETKSNLGDDWVRSDPEPTPEPPVLHDEVTPVAQLLKIPTKTSWRVPGFGKRQEPVLTPEPLAPPSPVVSPSSPSFAKTLSDAAPAVTVGASALAPMSTVASTPSTPEVSREPALHELGTPSEDAHADADLFKRPSRGFSWGWVFALFLLSTGVFAFMYQDLVLSEVEQFKKYLLRGTPAAAAPAEEAASAVALQAASEAAASAAREVASNAASVASAAEAIPASAGLDPKESLVSASSPLPVKAVSPVAVASAAAQAPASVSATETKSEIKAEAKPETKAQTELVDKNSAKPNAKEADTKSDEAWVNQLPVNGYVVQLAAFDSEEETQAFKRTQTVYAKARVMRVYKKDSKKRYFILVAGPWGTKAEADAFMQSSPVLAKGWLRSAKSLKAQFIKP